MTNQTDKQLASVPSNLAPQLKPYHFKPGHSGNPQGRPKEKLSKHERLVILSEIAKHQIEAPVSAGHKISAIHTHNLMEHVYQEVPPGQQDNRVINIIVFDAKTKELLQNINKRLLPSGDRAEVLSESTKEVENATDEG